MISRFPHTCIPTRILTAIAALAFASCAYASLPPVTSKAPGYAQPFSQLAVKNYSGTPLTDSLETLASGKRLVLYFWSSQDRMCQTELKALESFRNANAGQTKVLAVAFPALGDEDNALSRKLAEKYGSLSVVFDDSRKLYSLYCPEDKSESGSAFLVSPAGLLVAERVGAARDGELAAWITAAIEGKAPSPSAAQEPPAQVCPEDAKGHVFQYEIMSVIRSGYMTLPDGARFRPDAPVLAKDFVSCLKRLPEGELRGTLPTPDRPDEPITREQATKLFAVAAFSKEQIDAAINACAGAPVYLSDFVDAGEVSQWAEDYFALAVYKGWISDRYRLSPKQKATRGYIASLLARAFPGAGEAYTGLVVRVTQPEFKRVQSLQIVAAGDDAAAPDPAGVLYPDTEHLPPLAYLQSPGMVSYCPSVEAATEHRVGANPLVVTVTEIRKANGKLQLVISPEDADQARKQDQISLILRTWRVAVVAEPAVSRPTQNAQTQDPGAGSETTKPASTGSTQNAAQSGSEATQPDDQGAAGSGQSAVQPTNPPAGTGSGASQPTQPTQPTQPPKPTQPTQPTQGSDDDVEVQL